jgi:hypothetical protein
MAMTDLKVPYLWVALAVFGCADRRPLEGSSVPGPADASPSQDGSPAASLLQTIDDMDHAADGYPTLPEGSSAFFWRAPDAVGIGNWFVSSNGSVRDARIESIDPPRDASHKACRVKSIENGSTAELWAQLDHPAGRPVDLSGYAGIAFWARLAGGEGNLVVAIDNRGGGGYLQNNGSPLPSRMLTATEQWQQFLVPFDDFAFEPTAVVSIDFVAGGGEPFDLWIDDLALLCRSACP